MLNRLAKVYYVITGIWAFMCLLVAGKDAEIASFALVVGFAPLVAGLALGKLVRWIIYGKGSN